MPSTRRTRREVASRVRARACRLPSYTSPHRDTGSHGLSGGGQARRPPLDEFHDELGYVSLLGEERFPFMLPCRFPSVHGEKLHCPAEPRLPRRLPVSEAVAILLFREETSAGSGNEN